MKGYKLLTVLLVSGLVAGLAVAASLRVSALDAGAPLGTTSPLGEALSLIHI